MLSVQIRARAFKPFSVAQEIGFARLSCCSGGSSVIVSSDERFIEECAERGVHDKNLLADELPVYASVAITTRS
jgi:hypothetical protein